MAIVKLFGNLRKSAGAPQWTLPAHTVGAALDLLCIGNDSLRNEIFDSGVLRPHVRVMVNGHDIELAQGLDTPLAANDTVAVFPPMAGGSHFG